MSDSRKAAVAAVMRNPEPPANRLRNGHPAPPTRSDPPAERTAESPTEQKQKHCVQTTRGVFHVDPGSELTTFVCSPLSITADTRDTDSESWGRLLVWTDRTGREHQWSMPMEMLGDDGAALRKVLLNGGVTLGIGPKPRQYLMEYIASERPGRSCICVPHIGWHDRGYVLPDCAISPATVAESLIYQTAARGEHFYQTAGTLEEWRECIGRRCTGNSRLVFAVSAAFAGPLLRLLNVEGGGFHFVGSSSTGKSTLQWCAGSVCGGGHGAHGFARSWRFTQNALESMAELHNDSLLILDEMREIPEAKDLDSVVYMLANGSGKGRMNKGMTAQRTLHWQLLFLSSGEVRLSEYAASAGTRVKAGAEVRLLNVPADAGKNMGVFEEIHGAHSARVFAEGLKAAAAKTYGTPLRAFLDRLVRDRDAYCAQATAFMADFIRNKLANDAAPEVGRALRRVALVATAGYMATSMGITGWGKNEAKEAAERCFDDWITERGGTGQGDTEAGIRQVRAFFEINGASRFQSVLVREDKQGCVIEERVVDRAGYWKEGINENKEKERQFLVFPEVFKDQVCRGFDYRPILTELRKRDLLIKGDGKNLAKYETVPNEGRIRVYAIRSKILDGDEDNDDRTKD